MEFEWNEVLMGSEAVLCITDSGVHHDNEVRCSTGARAEEAKAACSKTELAVEDHGFLAHQ